MGQAKRRGFTAEQAGRLLACCPLFWWDHALTLLGAGLRFGELAGLRCRRVQLDTAVPVLQVVDVRYQAGRFGSGFKPRPSPPAVVRYLALRVSAGRGAEEPAKLLITPPASRPP